MVSLPKYGNFGKVKKQSALKYRESPQLVPKEGMCSEVYVLSQHCVVYHQGRDCVASACHQVEYFGTCKSFSHLLSLLLDQTRL